MRCHAQPLGHDVRRIRASGGVPAHQQPQDRRTMPRPGRVGRVRGQFDARSFKRQQQLSESGRGVGIWVRSSPPPSLASVAV